MKHFGVCFRATDFCRLERSWYQGRRRFGKSNWLQRESRRMGKKKKEGIRVFHPIPISGGFGPEYYPRKNRELWESIFQLGKELVESCEAQMLRHKKVSCPGGALLTLKRGKERWWVHDAGIRRGGFAGCRNPLIKTTTPFWLTGLLPCCVTPAWRRLISSVRFSSSSVFIHRVPWHFAHCYWEMSPGKGDPVTQAGATLGLLCPLVEAGRKRASICCCPILKMFLFKLQNNYHYDQRSCSALFLGTPVFLTGPFSGACANRSSSRYPPKQSGTARDTSS